MERQKINVREHPFKIVLIMYVVGIICHPIPYIKSIMFFLTPFVLIFTGSIVVYPYIKHRRYKLLLFLAITMVITYITEVIGVKTGYLFGNYIYGDTLGFKILGVPLIISFNWILVLLGSVSLAKLIVPRLFVIPVTIFFAVLFDVVMEPVAIAFNYWKWQGGGIPLFNYVTWGSIAGVFAVFYELLRFDEDKAVPAFYYVIQLIFFIAMLIYIQFL